MSVPRPRKNRRTRGFREQLRHLPASVQQYARDAYRAFERDPTDPGLRNHPLDDVGRGRHLPGSRSVTITRKYRAIYRMEGDTAVWYWVGTHADYDTFTGRK